MKWKDVKKITDKMSKEQLNSDVCYSTKYTTGILETERVKANLYYTYEDDPCELVTMKELKERYDKEEIEEMELYFKKGTVVFKIKEQ